MLMSCAKRSSTDLISLHHQRTVLIHRTSDDFISYLLRYQGCGPTSHQLHRIHCVPQVPRHRIESASHRLGPLTTIAATSN